MIDYRIYGFTACPYCIKAKALLAEERRSYEWVPIEDPDARAAFMDERGFKAPNRTFPRIYAIEAGGAERLVGGFTELETEILFADA